MGEHLRSVFPVGIVASYVAFTETERGLPSQFPHSRLDLLCQLPLGDKPYLINNADDLFRFNSSGFK